MARGRVKWYSAALGHGFIVPYDGGAYEFVREEEIAGDGVRHLDNDAEVTYETVQGRDGAGGKKRFQGLGKRPIGR